MWLLIPFSIACLVIIGLVVLLDHFCDKESSSIIEANAACAAQDVKDFPEMLGLSKQLEKDMYEYTSEDSPKSYPAQQYNYTISFDTSDNKDFKPKKKKSKSKKTRKAKR